MQWNLPINFFCYLTPTSVGWGVKKSSSGKSDELEYIISQNCELIGKPYSDLSLPPIGGIGVGTFIQLSELYGLPRLHRAKIPLPFLISDLKNWCKDNGIVFIFPKQKSIKLVEICLKPNACNGLQMKIIFYRP